jgi:AraC-like DNA-binding protein
MRVEHYGVTINPFPRSREVTVLFSGNNQTLPSYQVGPHMLDYYLVHLVTKGKGTFTSRGQKHELKADDCFFILPGEIVEYTSDPSDPWRYRWIGFRGNDAEVILHELGISADTPIVDAADSWTIPALFRRIQGALNKGGQGCDLKVGGFLRQLFGEIADRLAVPPVLESSSEADAKWAIDLAIHWLTSQYHRPVSINELAQQIGYHRSYLSRAFKKATGRTLSQHLLKLRMERSRALLQEPLTITEIASFVGFEDPLYFSKIFKKWHGCSPTDLRGRQLGMEKYQPQ